MQVVARMSLWIMMACCRDIALVLRTEHFVSITKFDTEMLLASSTPLEHHKNHLNIKSHVVVIRQPCYGPLKQPAGAHIERHFISTFWAHKRLK